LVIPPSTPALNTHTHTHEQQPKQIINKRLPGWQDPPSRDVIQSSLKAYDADGDGSLDVEEFTRFAKELAKSGPDTFFARVGKDAMLKTMLLPALAQGVKTAAPALGLGGIAGAPLAVLAPAVGCVFNAVRALVPV
jgi:hypothetical protein